MKASSELFIGSEDQNLAQIPENHPNSHNDNNNNQNNNLLKHKVKY